MSKEDTEFVWLPKAQVDLILNATVEVACMIDLVAHELRDEENEVAPLSETRMVSFIKTMRRANSVAMSIVTGDGRDFGEMYDEIHGHPYESAESSRGTAP